MEAAYPVPEVFNFLVKEACKRLAQDGTVDRVYAYLQVAYLLYPFHNLRRLFENPFFALWQL